jgi:biotin-dependent carboxylase-like uncharacterized protein
MTIADGETLPLGFARNGTFSYLAIQGGIAGEAVFGSLSVNARAGLGSPYPRPLQAGDELQVAAASGAPERRIELPAIADAPIRVVFGPQDDAFTHEARQVLLSADYTVSAAVDRMGMRLDGPQLEHAAGYNIISDGIAPGSIQVPGDRLPIVLLADRQTTGGYPKIATVISADLLKLGRLTPGSVIAFDSVSVEEAQEARRALEAELARLPQRLAPVAGQEPDPAALLTGNLISGVVTGRE